MFAKRLIQKVVRQHHSQHNNEDEDNKQQQQNSNFTRRTTQLEPRLIAHFGVPSTASLLAFDPIQSLLAIATLDGRIKVLGGDNIEALLISPNQLPYNYLQFLQNQGFLVAISNDNNIQVWDLQRRCIASCMQWDSNITAFSIIDLSPFMYVGDDYGLMSVLKFEADTLKLSRLPYHISANSICEVAGVSSQTHQPIVGILPQPWSSGNRVLIAYEHGLIILWDVLEGQLAVVKGDKDLQLEDSAVDSSTEINATSPSLEGKEISALCWASSDGSILAVGYVDGDILFWDTSSVATAKGAKRRTPSKHVVNIKLSSAQRRLPVIVLHWSVKSGSSNDHDGLLFVYGGDEIGSEEVLTVLNLEWSSGTENLRCKNRVDLILGSSFADMILLPNSDKASKNHKTDIFVLTNPGQLLFYDDDKLSAMFYHPDKRVSVPAIDFPLSIPLADPCLTVAKLCLFTESSSKSLTELVAVMKGGLEQNQAKGTPTWPLTGGVPCHMSVLGIQRLYIAGYNDGSVRLYDATQPVLSFICYLERDVEGISVTGSRASVTVVDFCLLNFRLAVGNECGLVRIYNLNDVSETKFDLVTETKHEVRSLHRARGPCCRAAFLLNSPITAMKFANNGDKLSVGFECGRMAMLDMASFSVLFMTDDIGGSNYPISAVIWKTFAKTSGLLYDQVPSDNTTEDKIFVLTKDAKLRIIISNGVPVSSQPIVLKGSIAISMFVVDSNVSYSSIPIIKKPQQSANSISMSDEVQDNNSDEIDSNITEPQSSLKLANSAEGMHAQLVLCCIDSLCLFSIKSLTKGSTKYLRKVKLTRRCCWTATLEKEKKLCGLMLLYETGEIEIRSFPDLEPTKESSLMSILRWNFRPKMEKTMCSTDDGVIGLVNGTELAFVSLLAGDIDMRSMESYPCLHDEVLAAAAQSFSDNQKKKQGSAPRILGGIVKGFKGGKMCHSADFVAVPNLIHPLEDLFSRAPLVESSAAVAYTEEVLDLDIDDIEIDEPQASSYDRRKGTSSHKAKHLEKGKRTEREKLLDETSPNIEPRTRTPEEILATYRKTGEASSAAAHARSKLVERQAKLERITRNTEELQSGAEDFANLANELVKTMEDRAKWWKI